MGQNHKCGNWDEEAQLTAVNEWMKERLKLLTCLLEPLHHSFTGSQNVYIDMGYILKRIRLKGKTCKRLKIEIKEHLFFSMFGFWETFPWIKRVILHQTMQLTLGTVWSWFVAVVIYCLYSKETFPKSCTKIIILVISFRKKVSSEK